jgi:hypothetical protein
MPRAGANLVRLLTLRTGPPVWRLIVDDRWTGLGRIPIFVDKGAGLWSTPNATVVSAPTEVPLDPSPEVTPEETLDSALDRPLDLSR